MIVVSDTSPVLNLALVNRLDLLREIYTGIIVPSMVEQEFKRNGFRINPHGCWWSPPDKKKRSHS